MPRPGFKSLTIPIEVFEELERLKEVSGFGGNGKVIASLIRIYGADWSNRFTPLNTVSPSPVAVLQSTCTVPASTEPSKPVLEPPTDDTELLRELSKGEMKKAQMKGIKFTPELLQQTLTNSENV